MKGHQYLGNNSNKLILDHIHRSKIETLFHHNHTIPVMKFMFNNEKIFYQKTFPCYFLLSFHHF